MPSYKEMPFDSLFNAGNEDDCWLWKGSFNTNGYGWHWIEGKLIYAHIYALARITPKPFANAQVMHSCDNPACVNPKHLSWGTMSENIKDMYAKGRQHKQTKKLLKLTKEDVIAIYNSKATMRKLAEQYNVSRQTICNIKNKVGYEFLNQSSE